MCLKLKHYNISIWIKNILHFHFLHHIIRQKQVTRENIKLTAPKLLWYRRMICMNWIHWVNMKSSQRLIVNNTKSNYVQYAIEYWKILVYFDHIIQYEKYQILQLKMGANNKKKMTYRNRIPSLKNSRQRSGKMYVWNCLEYR